jgi:hypothetical protein
LKIDRLKRACIEDTAVLTSALGWFDEELEKVQERCVLEIDIYEIKLLQGEARALRKLRDSLAKMARLKDDSGKETNQSRTRKN